MALHAVLAEQMMTEVLAAVLVQMTSSEHFPVLQPVRLYSLRIYTITLSQSTK